MYFCCFFSHHQGNMYSFDLIVTMRIHRKLIIKWANGYVIERLHSDGSWQEDITPTWSHTYSYRLKEQLGKNLMYQFTDDGVVVFDYKIGKALTQIY